MLMSWVWGDTNYPLMSDGPAAQCEYRYATGAEPAKRFLI